MVSREILIKNKLEKVCQCPVCLDVFKDPRTLNCQHTFCRNCLEQACLENQLGLMTLLCPTCRARQPLIYQRSDVTHVTSSLLVGHILELLKEWNEKMILPCKDKDELMATGNHRRDLHQFCNTKITRYYEAVNMNTHEHVQKLCIEEYGVRDERIKRLEYEIYLLKNNNTSLLMGNILLKMKWLEDNHSNEIFCKYRKIGKNTNEKHEHQEDEVIKTTMPKTKNDKIRKDLNKSNSRKVQLTKDIHELAENKIVVNSCERYTTNTEKNAITQEQDTSRHIIKYDKEKDSTILQNEVAKEITFRNINCLSDTESSCIKYTSVLCWRCFRTGHSGSRCRESTTVRGRVICKKCNLVGHSADTCTYLE